MAINQELRDRCANALRGRSAKAVFEDHLKLSFEGTVEEDLARNYADEVVVLTARGVYRGRKGVRHLAERLQRELKNCTFEYRTRLVEGDVAFLEWSARADNAAIEDGADTFVIRDGLIVAQTIHYTVKPRTSTKFPHRTDIPAHARKDRTDS